MIGWKRISSCPRGSFNHPLHQTYVNMLSRVKNEPLYTDIRICDRWLEVQGRGFINFCTDMGTKPTPKHTLDRYPNPFGDYEPSNCRWATWAQQHNNIRTPGRKKQLGHLHMIGENILRATRSRGFYGS